LGGNLENLILTGLSANSGTGNLLNNWITGNDSSNILNGGEGDDVLQGLAGNDTLIGGTGSDSMYGGLGTDTFHVDTQSDLIFENLGEGTDSVVATAGFYLYANVENLTLANGAGSIFGVGNELGNTLTGNEGDNLLIAWGDNDTLHGGAGNDSLFGVDGVDALFGDAGIDYLVAGIGNDTLDGGDNPDALYGEDGNDTLYGGTGFHTDILVGGAGNDVLNGSHASIHYQGDYDLMDGGSGDDTYYVDTPDDLTFEAAAGGTDSVIAEISGAGYYLWAQTENLTLVGSTPFGVGNELANILTGSEQANWLLGGAGNDTLNGKAGNDVLFGEAGVDTFVFERGTGGDVVGDFATGVDKVQLTGLGFTSFDQVTANMTTDGVSTALDLGQGDFVVFNGVTPGSFAAGDFVL
jgi:Ca2+-binding RTX toxin-like protein